MFLVIYMAHIKRITLEKKNSLEIKTHELKFN